MNASLVSSRLAHTYIHTPNNVLLYGAVQEHLVNGLYHHYMHAPSAEYGHPTYLPPKTDRLAAQVETSSNLASVTPIKTAEQSGAGGNGTGTYEILCSTRSSLSPPLEAVRRRIKKAAELCGASNVLRRQAYPGWQPDLQSNVLKVTRDVYNFGFVRVFSVSRRASYPTPFKM